MSFKQHLNRLEFATLYFNMMKGLTVLKKIIKFIIILLVGGLGSGVWELFLKDTIFTIGELFVRFFNSFISDYNNSLYENVGSGGEALKVFSSIILLVLLCLIPIFYYIRFCRTWSEIEESGESKFSEPEENNESNFFELFIEKHPMIVNIIVFFAMLTCSLMYVNLTIQLASETAAVNAIKRRLDIIRPYINENEYFKLYSEYRQIDGIFTLQRLINKTEAIAVEKKVQLPKVNLYGITTPKLEN
ncbi:hypothetical protein MTF66_34125 [Pseudoalteromonas sp. 2CM39R]|uniref:hypothetical protein n=1 Tax=unclassified Pseudoalteromonas TaxID=194690 RepID=UPI0006D65328|nr:MULTISPECIES: hypothetical protein [unclassified Pseudoalteromonas]KPZ71199.1 hypothetical protein AN394_02125 [Pseudoalteromonas sp. P1-26]MCK8130085.1 hypothetical protein [Pseudoalteromonas sp. 2CM39R]